MGYNNLFYWVYNYFSLPNYKGHNNLFLLGITNSIIWPNYNRLYNDLFLKGTLFDQIVIGYDNLFLLSIIIDQLIIGYFNLFLLVVTYSIG